MRTMVTLGTLMICMLGSACDSGRQRSGGTNQAIGRGLSFRISKSTRGRNGEKVAAPPAGQYPTPTGPITEIKVERKGEEKVPLSFGSTGSGKLVYAKPFLAAPKATIGGYADIKFGSLTGPTLDNPSRLTFNQERMVPFIYADITDRVKFAVEIEFERGGTNSPGPNITGTGNTACGRHAA